MCEYLSKISEFCSLHFQLQVISKQKGMIQGALCGGLNSFLSYACSLCVFVERWVTS